MASGSSTGENAANAHHTKLGARREKSDDIEVDELIRTARVRGDLQLEYLLREWRSTYGAEAGARYLRTSRVPTRL